MPKTTKPKIGDRKLEKEWSDDNARYDYYLYEWDVNITEYDGTHWRLATDTEDHVSEPEVWATRIAKHYNIRMPK